MHYGINRDVNKWMTIRKSQRLSKEKNAKSTNTIVIDNNKCSDLNVAEKLLVNDIFIGMW